MERTCATCGKIEKRRHRHGRDDIAMNVAYGRWAAEQERRRVAWVLRESHRRSRVTPL